MALSQAASLSLSLSCACSKATAKLEVAASGVEGERLATLCKRAVSLELEELKTIRLESASVLALETLLLNIYALLRPRPCDYGQRAGLVKAFNLLAEDTFGSKGGFPVVEAFGSFIMDLFTSESDLDLSINFGNDYTNEMPRNEKISRLRKFVRFLNKVQRMGRFSKICPILRARVPVVKVVDSGTGIECDISAENMDGISRSRILSVISSIDERFQILSYLMKAWAKAHDINSSKDRTMNSVSIISLVAFHLQTREPPILPRFAVLLKDGTDIASIENVVFGFKGFGRRNEESIAELFITLLIKLSAVKSLWSLGLCASTFEGSWINKEWESGIGNMSVEDFLDRSQNLARAVGQDGMKKVNSSIKSSLIHSCRALNGEIGDIMLKECLFGSTPLNASDMGSKRTFPVQKPDPINPITAKRPRYTETNEERNHNFHPVIPPNLPDYGPMYRPQPPFTLPPHPGYNSHFHFEPLVSPHLGFRPEAPFIPQHLPWLGHPAPNLGYRQDPFVPYQQFHYGPYRR